MRIKHNLIFLYFEDKEIQTLVFTKIQVHVKIVVFTFLLLHSQSMIFFAQKSFSLLKLLK